MRSVLRSLARRLRPPAAADWLRRCPVCDGRFPCPMDWGPIDDRQWHIALRCGDCGWWYEETVTNARAARFDRELDDDQWPIRRALTHLDRERMATEIELFVTALGRDLIDPGDFAPR
jgi:hypothetical protein